MYIKLILILIQYCTRKLYNGACYIFWKRSSSGSVSDIISSKYFLDVIITSKIPHIYIDKNMPYIAFASSSPYNNLNPETAYTSGDMQILMNTEEFLFYYNQTSGKYYPNIADYPEIKMITKPLYLKYQIHLSFRMVKL